MYTGVNTERERESVKRERKREKGGGILRFSIIFFKHFIYFTAPIYGYG